jgi:pilus assembly protein Flp/PilA
MRLGGTTHRFPSAGSPSKKECELECGREIEMKTLMRLWKDESGASAAEYALILAIIGAAIALAAIALGDAVANAMNDAAKCVNSDTSAQYSANCT